MASNQPPNVLIFYTDEQRFDCLGAYGNRDIRTPNIDALAADGVSYRNSFCCFPVCTPSRYSLLTGLYVHQHLGWNNHSTIPAGMETFPRMLNQAGYRTRAVGKMHFTPTYVDVGFEQMYLAEQHGTGRWDDDYHRYLRERGLVDRIDLMDQEMEFRHQAPGDYWDCLGAVESDLPQQHHSTTWIGDRAAEAVAEWSPQRPSLLMVGFIKPHHPFDPPAPWSRMYDPAALSLLPGWTESTPPRDLAWQRGYFAYTELTEARLRQVMAMYYATISQIDHHVGRALDLLKQKGLYDNTLIVYTSDHGDFMGFHHMLLKGNHMYDPVIKVPLIVKYPQQHGRGTVSDALVNNVDVAPTLLAAAGCRRGDYMDGLDLAAEPGGRDFVFAEDSRHYMVRSRTRKLLVCRDPAASVFFDLENDPMEMDNLLARPEHAAEVHDYSQRLARWALFDSPTRKHVDERGRRIPQPNVPCLDDSHREEMMAYFRQKMADAGDVLFGR